jgi:hypothetical protein
VLGCNVWRSIRRANTHWACRNNRWKWK